MILFDYTMKHWSKHDMMINGNFPISRMLNEYKFFLNAPIMIELEKEYHIKTKETIRAITGYECHDWLLRFYIYKKTSIEQMCEVNKTRIQ